MSASAEPSKAPDSLDYWRGRYDESARVNGQIMELVRNSLWQIATMKPSALVSGAQASLISVEQIGGMSTLIIAAVGVVAATQAGNYNAVVAIVAAAVVLGSVFDIILPKCLTTGRTESSPLPQKR